MVCTAHRLQCKTHIFQSIYFLYMQHRMFQINRTLLLKQARGGGGGGAGEGRRGGGGGGGGTHFYSPGELSLIQHAIVIRVQTQILTYIHNYNGGGGGGK